MSYDLHAVKLAAQASALREYGLLKTAEPGGVGKFVRRLFTAAPNRAPRPGWGGKIRDFGGQVAEMGRDMVFGSPLTMANELKKYQRQTGSTGRAVKRYYKNFYWPGANKNPGLGDKFNRVLSIGMPALDVYQAATGAPEDRAENLANAAVGLAGAPFTARLGIPGGMIQGALSTGVHKIFGRHDPRSPDSPVNPQSSAAEQSFPQTTGPRYG